MAIIKKSYEISVWDEKLGENGQKTEIKRAVIGADDMTYLGRATSPKFTKNLNGTHNLTFQLPSKFFDSEKGEYVHNEFCDYLFNERKVKLKHDGEWYEFYVKNITENKQFKSIMYQYTCEDAFIDELSRNGYGITFDTELYNNVEEIGTFTETILEDSIWEYDASKNWGDFTEYSEEKLFKIPIEMFGGKISAYKLNYQLKKYESEKEDNKLKNVFTGEERFVEMGDDIAREQKQFWDNGDFDKGIGLLSPENYFEDIPNDSYIYIPYSCLDFCYVKDSDDPKSFEATEVIQEGEIENIKSYLIAPPTIDPNYLIQFLAIPKNAEILVDEAGLIVNKDYHYVLPLKEWINLLSANKNLPYYYNPMEHTMVNKEDIKGVPAIVYDGYLEKINDIEINFGKKISITDRTEINISDEIDQYVTVYNNKTVDEAPFIEGEGWKTTNIEYRICSYNDTRIVVPQLARNYIQNGTNITDTSGWEIMKVPTGVRDIPSTITIKVPEDNEGDIAEKTGLVFNTQYEIYKDDNTKDTSKYNEAYTSLINFGITGQEKTIQKGKIYVFYMDYEEIEKEEIEKEEIEKSEDINNIKIIIGEGGINEDGAYMFISKDGEYISFNVATDNFPIKKYILIKSNININNPFFIIQCVKGKEIVFKEVKFFEAYTKGRDFFPDGYYKYSGRELFDNNFDKIEDIAPFSYLQTDEHHILLEEDVFSGDAYTYKRYFKQQIQYGEECEDTFMMKSLFDNERRKATIYSEDDFKIVTSYVDLSKCKYCNVGAGQDDRDCSFGNLSNKNFDKECLYQKYGYCPYLFETQKHCRKIRTLNGEKSNRFNLTQELSKIFEVYPMYYSEHLENGKIVTDKIKDDNEKVYDKMRKKVFYITEKGKENKLGFRYEKNLSNISRTFDSKEIVTKLYVEDVDSELSSTGLCSIKTAPDNPSKDSYIIDFSYYILKGLLDKQSTENDLYGSGDKNDISGFLKQMGFYNGKYDELSNKIINLQDESYTELEANLDVNLNGIDVALKELRKINGSLSKYESKNNKSNDSYKALEEKLAEQKNIFNGLIQDTFGSNDPIKKINESGFKHFKEEEIDTFKYECQSGIYGQFKAEYLQIKEWKKERAKYLEKINKLSTAFFKKYEPYLKEGTWSDSNYLSDNSYYFGAKEVAKQGAIPKLTYSITVVDLDTLDKDYNFDIADSSYIEDIETFGINAKTGLPNRLKVLISGITYDLDIPTQNTLQIQNYTTQFEDLFQQVSASVQSLSFNENIYKRSSNFTSTQNISEDSLQGGLSENQLTLIETEEKNIELDDTGQSGSDINNHANKYKLSGEGLFFSNNGGQSWSVGVTPKGINADYIKVGSLDASKISIVDGNYLYFLWDKGGITAYRTPKATSTQEAYYEDNDGNYIYNEETQQYEEIVEGQVVDSNIQKYSKKIYSEYFQDFARFNKYGLSLVENGKVRLRAGYSYKQESETEETRGDIDKESEIDTESTLGFYLYDSKGNKIFATETESSLNKLNWEEESARISLAGEIYTTDAVKIDSNTNVVTKTSYKYSNGDTKKNLQFVRTRSYQLEDPYMGHSVQTEEGVKTIYSSIQQVVVNYLKNNYTSVKTYSISSDLTADTIYEVYIQKGSQSINFSDLQEQGSGYAINGAEYIPFYKTIINIPMKISYKDTDSLSDTIVEVITYSLKSKSSLNGNLLNLWDTSANTFFKITEKDSFYLLSQEVNGGRTTDVLFPHTTVKYYKKNSNESISAANDNTLYYFDSINLFAYVTRKTIETSNSDSQSLIYGKTEMYINNKRRKQLSESETLVADQGPRLFCCVRRGSASEDESNSQVQNIFTILKNGELHIGGLVKNIDESEVAQSESLPTDIKLVESGIKIQGGTMYMDLSKFKDMETKEDILNIINKAVAGASIGRHAHEIKSLNLKINDKPSKYSILPTKETASAWKKVFQGRVNDQNFGNYFGYLIDLFVGNTVDLDQGKYNSDSLTNNLIPNFNSEITFDVINSRTEYAGESSGEQYSTYTYEDPVAE
ncbi:MAG: hypothetical protein ACI311_06910 [Bacilli bacterium]